jgi:hypothetical protein
MAKTKLSLCALWPLLFPGPFLFEDSDESSTAASS